MPSDAVKLAQLEGLKEQLASGVERASSAGKSAEFRSVEELRSLIADLEADLAGTPRRKQQRVSLGRGY